MKKDNKEVRYRHYLITSFLRPFISSFFKMSYKLKYRNHKELKENRPYVVLGNHTFNPDPIAMGLNFPFLLYYIASEQIFNLGFLSKLLWYVVNPIKKAKSVADMSTIRKVRRIVKEGGSIGIYPEGNVTYTGRTVNVQRSTVKLIKMLKLPVIFLISEGFYLSNPRWSINRKKGPTKQYVRRILEYDEYKDLSDDDLFELMNDLLFVDESKNQLENPRYYKGKNLALGLERLIFMDLDKNIPFVTYSKGNKLLSKESDFELTYLETGLVETKNKEIITLFDLENQIKEKYFNYYKNVNDKTLLYEESVYVFLSTPKRKIKLKNAKLLFYKDKISLEFKKNEMELLFSEINNISIQGKRQIIIYGNNETYLIKLNELSSPYKYLLAHQYYLFIKEGGLSINEQLYKFGL